AFVIGAALEDAVLLATTPRWPVGDRLLAARWGARLQELVWGTLRAVLAGQAKDGEQLIGIHTNHAVGREAEATLVAVYELAEKPPELRVEPRTIGTRVLPRRRL